MIKHLSVSNYALINQLEIDFQTGLSLITGETGAGKSILLGALGLLVGQRADSGVLQDKSRKCTVEAVFDTETLPLESFFNAHELDNEKLTTVRREITPEGKSRAFINDTPVTLVILKELGDQLIDIHSQHQTLTIHDSAFQLHVLDVFADNVSLLKIYEAEYRSFKKVERDLLNLKTREADSKKELDYLQFQFDELDKAGLNKLNQEELEKERELLNNAEGIKIQLGKATATVKGGESNLLTGLHEVRQALSGIAKYNSSISQTFDRVQSAYIELKDIATELESLEDSVHADPQRKEELDLILDELYRLIQKHNVKTVHELILLREDLSGKLERISTLETEIKALETALLQHRKSLTAQAKKLSERRKAMAPALEKDLSKLLIQLGMPHAVIQAKCETLPEQLSGNGQDKLNFFFSANKGSEPKPLHKVASGGELSRLMLCIKSILAGRTDLPTIIFDEIDTGVSGEVADKVGRILEQMATSMQVVAITHLPQIASKNGKHMFVYKEVQGAKTFSQIRILKKEERVEEIAKMLSAGNPSPAALKNARELLHTE
ncbi:MAG: DNA repair protein RecN [Bacteroidia bacterium]